ncbi:MAG: hypothetical protein ACI4AM_01765, partial [Muribaculaceae bacterium]
LFAVITEVSPSFSTPEPEEPVSEDVDEDILQAMENYYDSLEQAEKSAPAPSYRTVPRNLDLQVQFGLDTHYYFSVDEWNSLTDTVKKQFQKSGLVIDYWGHTFVADLHKYESGKREFSWDEAIKIAARQSAGWHLPSGAQAQALAIQYKDVCSAIKAFGGDDNPALWYWTADKFDESSACTYSLYDGRVGHTYTFDSGRIRFIRRLKCTDLYFDIRSGE